MGNCMSSDRRHSPYTNFQQPPEPKSHAWKLVMGVILVLFGWAILGFGFYIGIGLILWFILSEIAESRKMRRWEASQWAPYRMH